MIKNILYFSCFIITCNNLLSQSSGYEEQMRQYKKIILQEAKLENDKETNYDFEQFDKFSDSIYVAGNVSDHIADSLNVNDLKYFGYDFFSNIDRNIGIWNNHPPQKDYLCGPGDQIIIEVWGDAQLRTQHTIDQYGKIYIDQIGQIYLMGMTLAEIENKVFKKYAIFYSSLKGVSPTTFLDVSIGKLKSINITMLGESAQPGTHTVHPFSSITTTLLQTGGVLNSGTLRSIELIRNGKKIESFDFYKYLLNGDSRNDIRLIDGDIIFIPLRESSVSIEGEVVRPAIFELKIHETIKDLIAFSGRLNPRAMNKIRINRISSLDLGDRVESFDETMIIDILIDDSLVMKDGDKVLVYKMSENENKVFIYGQVKHPGEYSFNTTKDMLVMDLLTLSGGVHDTTFNKTMYLKEAEIIRNNANKQFPEVIKFNLISLLNGDLSQNIKLNNWDIVLIRENPKFHEPEIITISGEVKVPGIYTLNKRWEALDHILIRAGGFTEKAYIDGLQLYRNNEQISISDYNIIMNSGDSIYVPQPPGVVRVMGEVNRPSIVQFNKRKDLSDYIENSGGYTINADRYRITIVSANGDVKIKKRFRKTRITDGTTIIVHKKELGDPFDITQFATNIASISSSIATLFLLIAQSQ